MWDGVEADMRTKKKKHGRKADHLQAKETCMLMHFIVVSEWNTEYDVNDVPR